MRRITGYYKSWLYYNFEPGLYLLIVFGLAVIIKDMNRYPVRPARRAQGVCIGRLWFSCY